MRKLALLCLFIAFNSFLSAQSDLYVKVKKAMQEDHPEINLENHLVAVNIWSANNQESREANKQFNKNYSIYEFAKLKGGLKGLICVSINKEGESAAVLLSKDGATKLIQLNSVEVTATPSNFVFDDQGKEIYKNIPSEKIFESINKLITR
ncbi:MAG: hypothetical protein Q8L81_16060 [Bacteroidota bacterium]|nr:hypothetical protein [Bacteroidota bacterium]